MYFLCVPKESTKERAPREAAPPWRGTLSHLKKSARNKLARLRLAQRGIARLPDFSCAHSPASEGTRMVRCQATMADDVVWAGGAGGRCA